MLHDQGCLLLWICELGTREVCFLLKICELDTRDERMVESFLTGFEQASVLEKGNMLRQLKADKAHSGLSKSERKHLKRVYRTELVKRAALLKIVAAWLITVPISGLFAAIFYFTIRGMML
jgi:PiT family inorganic phosphate transporter